ncbi:MAG: universal stress protein [Sterolibacteriaceae bacterium MAG5]|nr:universal stress protein [Candidatus Nitricoxidireducens bremensis]
MNIRPGKAPPAAPSFLPHSSAEALMNNGDSTAAKPLRSRLLIPIDATPESRWGVVYALRRHGAGDAIEACFLNVGEPVTQWEVLRFRTQAEIAAFQSERAQAFIEEACLPLIAKDIPCRGFFKQGNVVFSILDTAEELGCDKIVLPRPTSGLWRLLGRDVVGSVIRRHRGIPIIVVGADGTPATETVT